METIILIIIVGLTWGSFLNVVIYRLPRRKSLLHPPSSCPSCGRRIRYTDNIPLLSFILLKGRCRFCGQRISLTYPLVELLTPLSFLLLHNQFSLSLAFFASCLFTSSLIVLGFIDYSHQILPDEITIPALMLFLLYALFRDDLTLRQALIAAVFGSGFLLFVYGVYYLLRKREGLGMGDVTMMLMVGAYLGLQRTLLTLIIGSFAGALVGLLLIFFKRKDLHFSLPFGSFLGFAAFISLLWGERIINAYLSLFQEKLP